MKIDKITGTCLPDETLAVQLQKQPPSVAWKVKRGQDRARGDAYLESAGGEQIANWRKLR